MLGDRGVIPNIPMATNESDSSITKSGIAEGSITITKPGKQKQDVSQINRNTEGTANVLKNSFDPQKVQERQETAALFGELAANAIHDIAKKNGWKDGSPEKIAMHAAVGAVMAGITKGDITAAAITGGSTEALSNTILKAVGKDKSSSAEAQWAAAVVGAALSSATGGDAQSGASIAANAVKNNHRMTLAEAKEVQNSASFDSEGKVWVSVKNKDTGAIENVAVGEVHTVFETIYNENRKELEIQVQEALKEFISQGKLDIKKMKADYISVLIGSYDFKYKKVTCSIPLVATVDRFGNTYIGTGFSSGVGTGVSLGSTLFGLMGKKQGYSDLPEQDKLDYLSKQLTGPSTSITLGAGPGGTFGVTGSGSYFSEAIIGKTNGVFGSVLYNIQLSKKVEVIN